MIQQTTIIYCAPNLPLEVDILQRICVLHNAYAACVKELLERMRMVILPNTSGCLDCMWIILLVPVIIAAMHYSFCGSKRAQMY